jgi:hypothetical protein
VLVTVNPATKNAATNVSAIAIRLNMIASWKRLISKDHQLQAACQEDMKIRPHDTMDRIWAVWATT